jgi:hypothetical protein
VYHNLYHTAEHCLATCGARIDPTNHSPDYVIRHSRRHWLFGEPDRLPFRSVTEVDPNKIWRQVHLSEEWMRFAGMASRLISVGTSEADCERSLSIQRNTVGDKLHHISWATLAFGKVIPSWDHRGRDTRATSASQISIK